MTFIERDPFDVTYWEHAQAAVSEGICPDCNRSLTVRPEVGRPECIPCEVDWHRDDEFSKRWVRFRRTEDIIDAIDAELKGE